MPTIKQKKALEIMVENGGNASKAMEAAGYSVETAKNPNKLTGSAGYLKLVEKYFPDKLLAKKHKELLKTSKKIRTYIKGDLTNEVEELDTNAISKGLDMAYKVKGYYAPEKNINFNASLEDLLLENLKRKNSESSPLL